MLRNVILAAALLAPAAAFADGPSPLDHNQPIPGGHQCEDYNGRPDVCDRLIGCSYDYRWDTCEYDNGGGGGGGGGNRGCSSYDFDPQTCNNQRECSYNWGLRRCENSFDPRPDQCWRYSNQPSLCDRTPGCSWDRRSQQCVDDFNNPPPPRRAVTRTINCSSGSYRYQTCPVDGEIVSAYLLRQQSSSRCDQGSTWGYQFDAIWVDRGCRGDFQVTYYPNW